MYIYFSIKVSMYYTSKMFSGGSNKEINNKYEINMLEIR